METHEGNTLYLVELVIRQDNGKGLKLVAGLYWAHTPKDAYLQANEQFPHGTIEDCWITCRQERIQEMLAKATAKGYN